MQWFNSFPFFPLLLLGISLEAQETSFNSNTKHNEILSTERMDAAGTQVREALGNIRSRLEQNDHQGAFDELNRITTLYPKLNLSSLYLSLADVFDSENNWRQSLAAYNQYLKQVLNVPVVPVEEYWNIGWAYYMTGYPEKALQAGINFARVYPNNTQHNLNLALYYLTLGYEAEATNLYMWSFSVTLDSLSLYALALHDLEKAKDLFFYAYSKDPLTRGWEQLKTLNYLQENL